MFHSKRVFTENKPLVHVVSTRELKMSNFYEASPLDVFLADSHDNPYSSVQSFRKSSDIYMLFNQQRLDRLTRTALLDHFNNMQVREPSFAALKSRLSDDQLCTLVKSRFIQSNSELLQWSNYLNSLGNEQLQQFLAVQQQQRKQQQQQDPENNSVDSASNPSSD